MEFIFDYETAKHTLILTAYWMLIIFDCYWIGYLITSVGKWVIKKIKHCISRRKRKKDKDTDAVRIE